MLLNVNFKNFITKFINSKPKNVLLERLNETDLRNISKLSTWLEKESFEKKMLLLSKLNMNWSLVFWDSEKTNSDSPDNILSDLEDGENLKLIDEIVEKNIYVTSGSQFVRNASTIAKLCMSKVHSLSCLFFNGGKINNNAVSKKIKDRDESTSIFIKLILSSFDTIEYLDHYKINLAQFRTLLLIYASTNGISKDSISSHINIKNPSNNISKLNELNYIEQDINDRKVYHASVMGMYVIESVISKSFTH